MDVRTDPDRETTTADATAGAGPGGMIRRLRSALLLAWPALVGYTAVRAVGLVTLAVWADARDARFGRLIGIRADAGWYLRIAERGYDSGERLQSDMAFFPLYPYVVSWLEPLSPLAMRNTAIAVAWVASLAAAWGLFAVGNHLHGRRTGVLLAVVWGLLPHAMVQSMAYTESLFTALAAWSLYAVLTRRWLTAGVLCLLAGLTRPTASALIPVVMLAALVALLRRYGGWRAAVALVLAPLGWVGYLAWVGWRTGRPDGWFHIQSAGWGSTFDAGAASVEALGKALDEPSSLQWYVVAAVALVSIALFVLSCLDRQPWPLLMFSGLLLLTTLGSSGYFYSKARFLLPAFALLLPVARSLAGTTGPRIAVVLVTMTAISAYFGSYLLLIWSASP
ncbi:hypothetical protein ACSNN9_08640 [Micromonospora sp. URMC 107]|uniref:hypothetical protein n=1 Tax=Micromonospora sp. URMC 107 TaxID=3423418 RepID=UPI003F1A5702